MGLIWDWYGTGMGLVWDWYGTDMGLVWDWYGTGMGPRHGPDVTKEIAQK